MFNSHDIAREPELVECGWLHGSLASTTISTASSKKFALRL